MASIRLPETLENRLEILAQLTKRSKSFYIKEALEQYLEDMEDGAIAMQRALDPKRKFLTTAQLRKNLKAHYQKQKH